MKKTFSIVCIIIVMSILLLALTSCGLELSNPLLRRVTRYNDAEKELAEKACTAIQNQDAEALRELFSEGAIKRVPNLSNDIDKLLSLFGTDIVSFDTGLPFDSGSIEGGERVTDATCLATITTSDKEYTLNLSMRVEDTVHPEEIGLNYILVYMPEQRPYVILLNNANREGIQVFSLDEPWYDQNALESWTLYMNDEIVNIDPPILSANGVLFPLFPLLDTLGAAYSQDAENQSIDVEYEDKHYRFTFPETENSNYQWISLTDLDNGRELRLSNSEKYHGLYTVIDGALYLSYDTGHYICSYLGDRVNRDWNKKTATLFRKVQQTQ